VSVKFAVRFNNLVIEIYLNEKNIAIDKNMLFND